MPWPKGRRMTPDEIAKCVRRRVLKGSRRKKPTPDGMWTCPTCRRDLPDAEFYRKENSTNGLSSQCRRCYIAGSVRTRNRTTHNAAKRRHEAKRRAWAADARCTITASDYDRLAMLLGFACLRCGATAPIQWDHIVPLSRGGAHSPLNLQPLCRSCNERKHARTADHRSAEQRAQIEQVWALTFRRIQ